VKASALAEGADDLAVIGRAGAGYDKIDLAACTAADVAVFNAPDTLTHATASSAFVLMLALAKRLTGQERLVRTARWDLQPQVMGVDLPGKVLGIVGLGASGRELARLAAPWGMTLVAYSPRASAEEAARLGVTLVPSLDEIFERSDFVSLHNRLDASTRGLITARHFALMKPTAYFINVARGEIVDEAALIDALANRRIAGAGLDVFEHEPLPAGHPLIGLDNVILTPHWLPSTRDAARLTMVTMANGMVRASEGLVPDNVLNREVLERPGFKAKLARFAGNRR
jgi:phosphoglycerate dehydrogenase-like enzyme